MRHRHTQPQRGKSDEVPHIEQYLNLHFYCPFVYVHVHPLVSDPASGEAHTVLHVQSYQAYTITVLPGVYDKLLINSQYVHAQPAIPTGLPCYQQP